MLENAFADTAFSFIALAAIAAGFVFLYVALQCTGLSRESHPPRVRREKTSQTADVIFLPSLTLTVENLVDK